LIRLVMGYRESRIPEHEKQWNDSKKYERVVRRCNYPPKKGDSNKCYWDIYIDDMPKSLFILKLHLYLPF
jgi:hypothetical protein